jgi:paraquat-inducible protein B
MSATRIPGLQLRLTSKGLASLEVGSPVAFRQIQVGEVTGYVLRKDRSGVDLTLVVYDRHKDLVRAGSRFYNASGVDVTLGGSGLKVETQSVAAMLLGGVSFLTPVGDTAGGPVVDGARFDLHPDFASIRREERIRTGLTIVLESAALGSIKRGDPVSYREVRVGEVLDAELGAESARVLVHVNIWPKYAPLVRENSVFWNASGVQAHFGLFSGLNLSVESLESLISGGLAFATPDKPGARVSNGATFRIAAKSQEDWLSWAPRIGRVVDAVVHAPAAVVRKGAEALGSEGASAPPPKAAAEAQPDREPEDETRTPHSRGGHRGF